ncbi:MAG: FadR/GntR family transcriptional regulator [Spirochaetales bacterium]|nr:FadR/GntR family transcriptional regulator [Spirochaetales bacterium]
MKNQTRKLTPRRLSDQVVDSLIAMIASGELKPGDKLPPEPQLMSQFGVGRSSIREAIGALELIGLLAVRPGDGTTVKDSASMIESRAVGLSLLTIGQGAIRELVEARAELEVSMAGFAAERASDEDIDAIREQHERIVRPRCSGREFIAADMGFHSAIAAASHNLVLVRFFSEIRQPVLHWMEQKTRYDWGREMVAEEHGAIVDAIAARDAGAARAAMRKHIVRAGDKLIAAMQESQAGT